MNRSGFRNTILGAILFLSLLLAVSTSLTYSEMPEVVFLHTERSKVPNIVFRISSIPLAVTSFFRSGSRVFAVLPATRENIEVTLARSRAVVIGTHGIEGGIFTDEGGWIGPDSLINSKMKLIYFGSCYFGKNRERWQAKFPNAKVIGYDHLTYPFTGWIYLVFRSWYDLLAVD